MSLRPHTYVTPSISPRTFAQPFPSRPVSPNMYLAEEKHLSQLSTYKRDPGKAAAAIRLASLQNVWAKADERRRSEDELEDGDVQRKTRRRRWYMYGGKPILRRWTIYGIGMFFLYLTFIRPWLFQHEETPQEHYSFHGNSSRSISIKRSPASRSPVPRAPLPPALLAKTALEHKVEDGLLKVNPQSTVHPIHQLIRDARDAWDKKMNRQSKTLLEATKEYQGRYGRRPPKGFDKWWEYVVQNDVPLPDEYDQIHHDLLPFRALSPKELNKRIQQASKAVDTYTLRIKRGSIRTHVFYSADIQGADERLEQQTDLLRPIAKYLPDMQMVWSVHDTPRSFIGWDHKRELIEHVEEEEWFDENDEIDLTLSDWSAACPPRSSIKSFNPLFSNPTWIPDTSLTSKSFISSHSQSLDLCSHPDIIPIHGALAGKIPKVNELIPIFTLSKTKLHSDVLGVPVEQWLQDDTLPEIPFEEKEINRLLWRGSNTGTDHSVETPWRTSHRTRLIYLTNYQDENESENLKVDYIPPPKGIKSKVEMSKLIKQDKLDHWNQRSMDLGFTGGPIQCNVDDGTCDDLMEEFSWTEQMTHDEALNYKYVIDVDGNAWSARFKRLLASGSLILKATIMPEWWTDRIQPWVHYVPIQMDYSDLYDIMAFFQGLPSTPGETALARDIANAGKNWSATHWRKEDMIAYMFRLYLEWGRLVADRRSSMDFEYEERMEMRRS